MLVGINPKIKDKGLTHDTIKADLRDTQGRTNVNILSTPHSVMIGKERIEILPPLIILIRGFTDIKKGYQRYG